jgi:hypothetical protein
MHARQTPQRYKKYRKGENEKGERQHFFRPFSSIINKC